MPYNSQDSIQRIQDIINKSQPDYFGRTNISFSDLTPEDIAAIRQYLTSGGPNPWQGIGPKITPPPVATPTPPPAPPGTTPPIDVGGNIDAGNIPVPNGGYGLPTGSGSNTTGQGDSNIGAQTLGQGQTLSAPTLGQNQIGSTPSNWNFGAAAKAAGKDFAHNLPYSMSPIALGKSIYAGIKGGYTEPTTGTFTSSIPGLETTPNQAIQNMVDANTANAQAEADAANIAAENAADLTAYDNMYGEGDAGNSYGDGGYGYDTGGSFGSSWGVNSYAQGGTPPVGVPVQVGERGRELFVPQQAPMATQMMNAGKQRRMDRPTPQPGRGFFGNFQMPTHSGLTQKREDRTAMRRMRPGNMGTGTSGSGIPNIAPTPTQGYPSQPNPTPIPQPAARPTYPPVGTSVNNAMNFVAKTLQAQPQGVSPANQQSQFQLPVSFNSTGNNDINAPVPTMVNGVMQPGYRFATGGRPPMGRPVMVGEQGPEMFVADRPGTIVPNDMTEMMLRAGNRRGK